jgi:cytochrome c5
MKAIISKASTAICTLGLTFAALSAQAVTSDDVIAERLMPAGKVCLQGDESCGSASAAPAGGTRTAEDTVATACNSCHGTGVLGAPKIGSGDWAARLDAKGLDTLVSNAINGIGAMPARGTCSDCTDDDIKAAIEYMIAQ